MRLALLALLLPVLSSGALAETDPGAQATAGRLVKAIKRHDAKAIAEQLATPFQYTGAWFPDAACTKRFGSAGVLETRNRDAFAKCIAKLVPQLSTRAAAQRDHVVITFEPGIEIEIEATLVDNGVLWLGAAGAEGNGKPMLTAQTFEALRTRGETLLDDNVRGEMKGPGSAWIRTCLDEQGSATRTVAWASSTAAGDVFLRATADWTFKPFAVRGEATPACSLSLLTYPASAAPSTETLPRSSAPRVGTYDFEDDLDFTGTRLSPLPSIATIQQTELLALAMGPLDPKPASSTQLLHTAHDRISSINVCIDTTGAVKNAVAITRQPNDLTRVAKIRRWRFKPYRMNGIPNDACALVQFALPP